MQTSIGEALRQPLSTRWTAGAVAAAMVVCDLVLTHYAQYMTPYRLGFLLVTIGVYGSLCRWDTPSLGLTLRPIQGYVYWVKATLVIGLIMLGVLGTAIATYRIAGWSLHLAPRPLSEVPGWFYFACINAPILEEIVYRFILCVAAAAVVGPMGAIILSGIAFGALHVVAGVASPDNLIAGFILAWAYLKSGSLAVPITLHALGNFCILAVQVALWFLT